MCRDLLTAGNGVIQAWDPPENDGDFFFPFPLHGQDAAFGMGVRSDFMINANETEQRICTRLSFLSVRTKVSGTNEKQIGHSHVENQFSGVFSFGFLIVHCSHRSREGLKVIFK